MINFSLNVDPEVLDCITLKLVIQPLIENSIVHGIEKKGENGQIDITVRREDDKLVFIISDNGYGVDLEEIARLLDKTTENNKGFAIKNVNDRIKLYFGEDYGLEFFSRINGTTAVITQPYNREAMEND
jgi:Putative regulator of cell autolysis